MHQRTPQPRGTGIVVVASLFWAVVSPVAANRVDGSEPARGVPWLATDALGRSLPMAGDQGVPAPRADRFVGLFYFLWHNDSRGKPPAGSGPYDVSRILAQRARRAPTSRLAALGPDRGMYHYWAEPLYGYYFSADPWVFRRHAQLLSAAGIDVLIFDTTNAVTYPEVYRQLCAVFEDVRKSGGRTPQIAFMVNTAGRQDRRPALQGPLRARAASRPLVHLGRQAAVDLRPQGGQPRSCGASSRSAAPTGRSRWSTPPTPGTGRPPIRSPTATRRTRRRPSRSTSRWRRTSASATAR